ncbi:hypothetical protein [Sinosporangium siamense]|uniref:Uncharacterized protein n=1 Tax=Sinosporangium siamense TaxID=1367973 RepID=A0A919RLV8_9ACTN|nr:hypothetical protein [Sinosporangium siamense]GII94359.1 hypothetical protein Ssi02_45900 [Sinosporangium siamense]
MFQEHGLYWTESKQIAISARRSPRSPREPHRVLLWHAVAIVLWATATTTLTWGMLTTTLPT